MADSSSFVPVSDAPRRVPYPENAPKYFTDYVSQVESYCYLQAQAIRQLQGKVAALESAASKG